MATPLDFPDHPTIGQIYNAPNGVAYVWDGVKWNVVTGAGVGGATVISIGPLPPDNPQPGWLWWRSDPDGNLYVWYNDGTSAQWVPAMATMGGAAPGPPVTQYYLVAGAVAGVPTASLSLGFYVAALPFTLPVNLTASQAVAKTAATAQTDLTILVNGVSKGSIRFAAAGTVASFVFASPVVIAAGDRIELVAPGTPDATLADFTWTLRGTL